MTVSIVCHLSAFPTLIAQYIVTCTYVWDKVKWDSGKRMKLKNKQITDTLFVVKIFVRTKYTCPNITDGKEKKCTYVYSKLQYRSTLTEQISRSPLTRNCVCSLPVLCPPPPKCAQRPVLGNSSLEVYKYSYSFFKTGQGILGKRVHDPMATQWQPLPVGILGTSIHSSHSLCSSMN